MKQLTVAEAARRLHVPERKVREFIRTGKLEVVGRGPNGAQTVREADVDELMTRLRIGEAHERERTILVVEDAALELHVTAARAAGLKVVAGATIIDAIEQHHGVGMPILVVSDGLAPTERRLLQIAAPNAYVVVVGRTDQFPPMTHRRVDSDDVRGFVQLCWTFVAERVGQLALKL